MNIVTNKLGLALLAGALVLAVPAYAQSVSGQSSYSNFGKVGSSPGISESSSSSENLSANSQRTYDNDAPRAEMEATAPSSGITIQSGQSGSLSGNAGISSQSSFSNFGKVGSTPNGSVQ